MKYSLFILLFFGLQSSAMQKCQKPEDCCMQIQSAAAITASCLELGAKIAEFSAVFALETFKMSAGKSAALDKFKKDK